MRVATICLLVGALIFGMVGGVAAEDPPAEPKIAKAVGDMVPAWEAKTVGDGTVVSSAKMKGDYALVFVNSSCSACRKEMQSLSKMEFKGLDVFIASVDFKPEKTLMIYREAMGLTFPILDASDFKLLGLFNFAYTPASVLVKDGKVEFMKAGYRPQDEAEIQKAFGKYAK